MADELKYEILEDGTVSITSGKVSDANHFSADDLLNEIEMELGGKRTTTNIKDKKARVHAHKHVHQH